jgi:PQQ-dependent dehydrogenase (methanol/ethanol family)
MTNHHDHKMQWFWLGVWKVFSVTMACTLSQLRSLMMTAFVGAAICTTVYAQTQDPSAKAPPSVVAIAQPSTQGPTQAEMDKADTDPNQWLTSNKGYLGYRYSKLAEINTQNVSILKTVCSFKLGEQGSFQSAPLVYNGVLYMTSVFGTFAIDAASCKKRWSYQHPPGAHMGQRNNKGAAISNGRVIRGTPDGHLIALDAATGTLLWDRTIMDASAGEYATAVPLVWKDMIFIGKAGGELGIRGEMMAFRAADGTKIWGFHTIPGGGETGTETWKNPASIAHGGGATWTSYSLDPVSGLLLLPVGNAGPDFDNESRPGTNLFTNSIVALDALTGQLKWWHQLVGPDDHDWDTTIVAAFDTADGSHLAAGAGKDGVLHVLDRASGKLLFTTSIVSQYSNRGTPIPTDANVRFCPVAATQWNGPAYSPDTNLLYMNGIDWCARAIKGPTPKYVEGKPYLGWATPTGYGNRDPIERAFGLVNAIDPTNGRLLWRYRVPSPPVAGLVVTAAGLLLTADTQGDLFALDAKTGTLLLRRQVGAGAMDGGLITYKVNGRQFIAVGAGDNNPTYKVKGDNAIVILGLP